MTCPVVYMQKTLKSGGFGIEESDDSDQIIKFGGEEHIRASIDLYITSRAMIYARFKLSKPTNEQYEEFYKKFYCDEIREYIGYNSLNYKILYEHIIKSADVDGLLSRAIETTLGKVHSVLKCIWSKLAKCGGSTSYVKLNTDVICANVMNLNCINCLKDPTLLYNFISSVITFLNSIEMLLAGSGTKIMFTLPLLTSPKEFLAGTTIDLFEDVSVSGLKISDRIEHLILAETSMCKYIKKIEEWQNATINTMDIIIENCDKVKQALN